MKELLLKYVNEIGSNTKFWDNEKKELGSSNIRNLAIMANNAECYKEFRLFIQYKTAKGNGWNKDFNRDERFGDVILRYMDDIYERCNRDENETLKNISKFFGYLYWKRSALEK